MKVAVGRTHGMDAATRLAVWLEGPLGETLLAKEAAVLFQGVRRFHGDALLWLGPVPLPNLQLDRCMVRHRTYGALTDTAARQLTAVVGAGVYRGCMECLPFAPGTLDAVVVHHGFECSTDSRMAIREIAKALRPGGRLLICAFNPWSFWGLRRLLAALRRKGGAPGRFLSPARLVDWLAVLGFEVDDGVHYIMYRPPVTRLDFERSWWTRARRLLERWQLPFGGVYTVLARKSAVGLVPLSGSRALRDAKLATALPGSTARSPQ